MPKIQPRYVQEFGTSLSLLGYGGMRFPTDAQGQVDSPAAIALLRQAYESGVNYFDTAVVYHKGESEKIFAKAFAGYDRSTYHLADKMSIWVCKTEEEMKALFYRQLETLGVDYIDFYLLHNANREHYALAKKLNCLPFLRQMKAQGKIKHLGFSFHDTLPIFQQILDENEWDFAQIQLNYLDWSNQHADQLYRQLEQRGIPCMVMEPVRGGYLANLDEKRAAPFRELAPQRSVASWAIRWAASLPNVRVVLSGMSNQAQLEDNLATLGAFEPLSAQEQQAVKTVVEEIRKVNDIPCTGCRYCMDCPQGVDIPEMFTVYSKFRVFENPKGFVGDYENAVEKGYDAGRCVGCGACVGKCPQRIAIPEQLGRIRELYRQEKGRLEG